MTSTSIQLSARKGSALVLSSQFSVLGVNRSLRAENRELRTEAFGKLLKSPVPNPKMPCGELRMSRCLKAVPLTLALAALRLRWFGFPFHPLGYALSSSWAINICWLPLLMAWVFKCATMRFSGLAGYRRTLPFFLGLILGDCVLGSAWALISLLLNIRTYNFFGS